MTWDWGACQRDTGASPKGLPGTKAGNRISHIVLDYNTKYRINMHECISEQVGEHSVLKNSTQSPTSLSVGSAQRPLPKSAAWEGQGPWQEVG